MHRRRVRRWISVLLILILLAGGLFVVFQIASSVRSEGPETCRAPLAGEMHQLTPSQASYAALIAAVGVRDGRPPRATTIALATAIQESTLRNLDYGDAAGPDSRGLFQQRPSQGWGSEEQIMDPYYATATFYRALVKIPNYQNLPITEAAQAVQRSAFPDAYGKHESAARAFASALSGQSPAAFSCSLDEPSESGAPAVVQDSLRDSYGALTAEVSGRQLRIAAHGSKGWSVAHWAVANAKELNITRVDFDSQTWLRENRDGWSATQAASAGEVIITVAAGPGG